MANTPLDTNTPLDEEAKKSPVQDQASSGENATQDALEQVSLKQTSAEQNSQAESSQTKSSQSKSLEDKESTSASASSTSDFVPGPKSKGPHPKLNQQTAKIEIGSRPKASKSPAKPAVDSASASAKHADKSPSSKSSNSSSSTSATSAAAKLAAAAAEARASQEAANSASSWEQKYQAAKAKAEASPSTTSETNLTPVTGKVVSTAGVANGGHAGNGGNDGNGAIVGTQIPGQPHSPNKKSNWFIMMMAVVGLGLSIFTLYKVYQPSLFPEEGQIDANGNLMVGNGKPSSSNLERDAGANPTEFEEYKAKTEQEIEILRLQLQNLQQQVNAKLIGSANSSGQVSFGDSTGVTPTTSATPLQIKYLNDQLQRLQRNVDDSIQRLYVRVGKLEEDQAQEPAKSPSSVEGNSTTSTSTGTANEASTSTASEANPQVDGAVSQEAVNQAIAKLTPEQLNAEFAKVIEQLKSSPEFKDYIKAVVEDLQQNTSLGGATPEEVLDFVSEKMNAYLETLKADYNISNDEIQNSITSLSTSVNSLSDEIEAVKSSSKADNLATAEKVKSLETIITTNSTEIYNKVNQLIESNQKNLLEVISRLKQHAFELEGMVARNYATLILTSAETMIRLNMPISEIHAKMLIARRLVTDQDLITAIDTDIKNLTAMANTDVKLVAVDLSNLLKEVNQLPAVELTKVNLQNALGVSVSGDLPKSTSNQVNNQVNSEPNTTGEKVAQNFFHSFIEVKKNDQNAANFNQVNAQLYVNQNIRLGLNNALLASQTNNIAVYKNSLEGVIFNLENFYPQNHPAVSALLTKVKALAELNFAYDTNYQLKSLFILIPR